MDCRETELQKREQALREQIEAFEAEKREFQQIVASSQIQGHHKEWQAERQEFLNREVAWEVILYTVQAFVSLGKKISALSVNETICDH